MLKTKSKILWFEPVVFLFFGLFHMHRIWGLVDRTGYANFWLGVMNNRGVLYFSLMGVLSALSIAGIVVFFRNIDNNYWWRWIYIFGGGYVLFDLFAIVIQLKVWDIMLEMMYDTTSIYWNYLWGFFIVIGFLSFVLGLHIIKIMKQAMLASWKT
jgi:hypothetical protein